MTTHAILFDLYGTLVDDGPTVWDPVVPPMAAALNLPVEDFRRAWVATWPQRGSGQVKTTEENLLHILSSLQADGLPNSHPFPIPMGKHALEQSEGDRMGFLARAADIFRAHLKTVLTPRPDALALLTTLKARGYPLALISNIALEAPAIWSATAASRLFDFAAYSSHLGLMKPDPAIFQAAFDALNVTPDCCLYIADGNDRAMETVQALHMPALLIRTNYHVPDSFRLTPSQWPGPRLTRLSQVPEHLDV